jgi:cytidine deaminase
MSQKAQKAIRESYCKRQQHNVGQLITVQYFGHMITGKIIEIPEYGTAVIETPSSYRIRKSGLSLDIK